MADELLLKDLDGGLIKYSGTGTDFEGSRNEIIKSTSIYIAPKDLDSKIVMHQIPSAGLILPKIDLSRIILTLEKGGYGWYSVNLVTDPILMPKELFNSHYRYGGKTPADEHWANTSKIYNSMVKTFMDGNFKVHLFYDMTLNIEEIKK